MPGRRPRPDATSTPDHDHRDAPGPTWTTFRVLARDRRVIPVVRRLLADGRRRSGSTASSPGGPGTFLLESAEHGGVWSRYSFIGVRSRATLIERDGAGALARRRRPSGVPTGGDPVEALRETVAALAHRDRPTGLPPLTGGMVGYLSYDLVRRWERLPDDHDRTTCGCPSSA